MATDDSPSWGFNVCQMYLLTTLPWQHCPDKCQYFSQWGQELLADTWDTLSYTSDTFLPTHTHIMDSIWNEPDVGRIHLSKATYKSPMDMLISRLCLYDTIDTACAALGMFSHECTWPRIECNSFVIINHFWSKILRMRIKVLFLKRTWFVRPDKTQAWPLFCVEWLELCPHLST